MVTRDHDAALGSAGAQCILKILQLDVAGEVFARQPRAPQKVEHRAREMLKRCARNPFALARRKLIAECDREVSESNLVTLPVEDRHQRPEQVREMKTYLPRQQRPQLRCRA